MTAQIPNEMMQEAIQIRDDSVRYIADHLKQFLRDQEKVLVCFSYRDRNSLGGVILDAVEACGAVPVTTDEDFRWKNLLRLAFLNRVTAVIGPPDVVLGLRKVANATKTPLYIRNVLVAGMPSESWRREGIRRGLDCRIWRCYAPGGSCMICGFSDGSDSGIRIRSDVYKASVTDHTGASVPEGQRGDIRICSRNHPGLLWDTAERAILQGEILRDISAQDSEQNWQHRLEAQMLSWSSVLDFRADRTEFGMELEVVQFSGEKIPPFPSCAKLILRDWDPDQDVPFSLQK